LKLNGAGNPDRNHRDRPPNPGRKLIHLAYLELGSNIEPVQNLPRAVEYLQQQLEVEALSRVWETPPEGTHGVNFLNAAVLVRTPLSSGLLKSLVLRPIEARMGRVRTANKNAPRPIDLDIVVFDGQAVDPKIWTHAFVAVPLAELAPDLVNPVNGESLRETAQRLSQAVPVKPRPDVELRPPTTPQRSWGYR
jgi:2-amino-4-hydroxy-6-hydroxymethyldihydropteridine diphosphokinase